MVISTTGGPIAPGIFATARARREPRYLVTLNLTMSSVCHVKIVNLEFFYPYISSYFLHSFAASTSLPPSVLRYIARLLGNRVANDGVMNDWRRVIPFVSFLGRSLLVGPAYSTTR